MQVFEWHFPAEDQAENRRQLRMLLAEYIGQSGFFHNRQIWDDITITETVIDGKIQCARPMSAKQWWVNLQDMLIGGKHVHGHVLEQLFVIMARLASMRQGVSGSERCHSDRMLITNLRGPERGDERQRMHMFVYLWHRFLERRKEREAMKSVSLWYARGLLKV